MMTLLELSIYMGFKIREIFLLRTGRERGLENICKLSFGSKHEMKVWGQRR